MTKVYDHAYFEKWYRHPRHTVGSKDELRRKVALAVAVAEYYLGRPIESVLDVGCGEAPWRAPLRALRPRVDYRGLDASEYVVKRYGKSRNIGLARFGDLASLRLDRRFDLIVCSDVLHYLKPAEIRAGSPASPTCSKASRSSSFSRAATTSPAIARVTSRARRPGTCARSKAPA
jgi:SAM-dependent methyltransferase